jgi:hypothetical protein
LTFSSAGIEIVLKVIQYDTIPESGSSKEYFQTFHFLSFAIKYTAKHISTTPEIFNIVNKLYSMDIQYANMVDNIKKFGHNIKYFVSALKWKHLL